MQPIPHSRSDASSRPRVGFVGLGDQGEPIAHRILDAAFPLAVYARRRTQSAPLVQRGATDTASIAQLATVSDVLCICVGDDRQVRDVCDGALGHLAPGSVIAIHSTIHPATCTSLGIAATDQGVAVVDAPVSGGRARAFAGQLTVMVGGDVSPVERCRPVFEAFGAMVLHVGSLGSGQVLKLVNNALFTAQVALARDLLTLVDDLGLDVRECMRAVAASTGGSRCLQMYVDANADHVFPRHSDGRARGAELLTKDIALADDVFAARGVVVPATLDAMVRLGLAIAIESGELDAGSDVAPS